jgi:hypothetical protein
MASLVWLIVWLVKGTPDLEWFGSWNDWAVALLGCIQRPTSELATAERLLRLVPRVPTPVWGRDEFGLGEMRNSNSVISWLIAGSGLDARAIDPPARGRAPGWHAGILMAERCGTTTQRTSVHRDD